jgi:hypothetical protein
MGRAQRAQQVTESMRTTGGRRSDQGAVWDDIAQKAARMEAPSPTGAMHAIYERHGQGVEEYLRAFAWAERQAGLVFRIGGAAAGLDLLDHSVSLKKVWPKLIRSYALDALEGEGSASEGVGSRWAEELLERVAGAPTFSEPAVGLGKDVRMAGPGLSGAALWVEERYVHVCAFASGKLEGAGQWQTRMSRPSRRGGRTE